MSFVTRLMSRLRKAPGTSAEEELFDLHLRKMNSRYRAGCRATPFKNSRSHQAV